MRMKSLVSVVSFLASVGCATTTTITSDARGAEVTSAKGKLGKTPLKYETKMWVWESETVTVSAPGHKPRTVELKRSELDIVPMVGAVCMAPLCTFASAGICAAAGWKLPATTAVKLDRGEGPVPPSSSGLAAGEPPAALARLLVLEVQGTALDAAAKRALAAAMTQELAAAARFTVLSQADVNQLAELEGQKQELGCSTSSCLAEIAGAMGARYVIFGDAAKLGALTVVNLNLFDTQTASAVQRASFEAKTLEEIPARGREAAQTLLAF